LASYVNDVRQIKIAPATEDFKTTFYRYRCYPIFMEAGNIVWRNLEGKGKIGVNCFDLNGIIIVYELNPGIFISVIVNPRRFRTDYAAFSRGK